MGENNTHTALKDCGVKIHNIENFPVNSFFKRTPHLDRILWSFLRIRISLEIGTNLKQIKIYENYQCLLNLSMIK